MVVIKIRMQSCQAGREQGLRYRVRWISRYLSPFGNMILNSFVYSKNSCTGRKLISSQKFNYTLYIQYIYYLISFLLFGNLGCSLFCIKWRWKVRKYCFRKSTFIPRSCFVNPAARFKCSSISHPMIQFVHIRDNGIYLGLGITKENCFPYFTFS